MLPLAPQASASANSATSAGGTNFSFAAYFFGAAGGCFEGVTPIFGCVCAFFCFRSSELPPPVPRVARIERDIEVTMKTIADTVVAFDNSVAEPRGPKAVCEPIPPNAPARSAALPLCSSTTTIRKKHTMMCTIVNRMITAPLV